MSNTKTIGKDYSLKELILFCLPSIANEFVISLLYTLDDGFFISRYVGHTALAAFGILFTLFMLHGALGALLGGVSILCAKKLGEKKEAEANSNFTTIILYALFIGLLLAFFEHMFAEKIVYLLGATDIIFPHAYNFLKISSLYAPLTLISTILVRFYVPAGKPQLELVSTILNMSCNLFFDWYFVVYKGIGMVGAAYANLIAVTVQVIFALFFFTRKNSEIHFSKPDLLNLKLIKDSSKYGLSSFVSNMSVSISTLISNYVILHYGNEIYLAAYNIVNNISFTFMACYFGLFGNVGSLLSYAMGERNKEKLLKLFKQIIIATTLLIIVTTLSFMIFGKSIADIFINENSANMKDVLYYGMKIAPYSFLFFGYNVGARMCFASLGNINASSFLTIIQEVILSNISIIVLPMLFGIKGVWFSFLFSNILTLFVVLIVVYINRDNYGYGKDSIALLLD